MKKNVHSVFFMIGIGILEVALILALYLGTYLLLEVLFFPNTPQAFPADRLRITMSVSLYSLYIVLLKTKLKEFWKAAISVGPNCVSIIAIVLTFYEDVWLFLSLSTLFVLLSLIFMVKHKAVWYFYFTLAYGVILGLLYSWPQ